MMFSTQTSSFQLNGSHATPTNSTQNAFNNQSMKLQNKLKIAIKPQNEYLVNCNLESQISTKDQTNNLQQKKQQQIIFQPSLLKAPSQGTLNKSATNQAFGILPQDFSNNLMQNNQSQLQKKNSCQGLTISSKTFYGYDNISSPQMPLTAKAAESKNNFYFAQKKSNINKRTIFKFNDKIWDNSKKPSQNGIVITTMENSPKQQSIQKSNAPSLTTTSRASMDLNQQDKKTTSINFNKLSSYLSTETGSKIGEQSNNNNKSSQNGNQQITNSSIIIEFRKLQVANYKFQQKIQQLEKLNQEQEEKLYEKDQIIAAYESKSQGGSASQINSVNTTAIRQNNPKKLVKIPSILQNNMEQAGISNNNSFNTNDKKNFSGSTAQMSVSLIKSPYSPQRSILHTSTISNVKGLQQNMIYPQSTNDLVSPKNQKHKTKLLSINLQNQEVKEFINNSEQNTQFSNQNPHFGDIYQINQDAQHDNNFQMFQLISPEKEKHEIFDFQGNEQVGHKNENKYISQSDKIQEGLKLILERMRKLLQNKK